MRTLFSDGPPARSGGLPSTILSPDEALAKSLVPDDANTFTSTNGDTNLIDSEVGSDDTGTTEEPTESAEKHGNPPVAMESIKARLSARDKAYLDKYYDEVVMLARTYDVDPALVLGVGIESDFASKGAYLKTGDAFGMTGGSTKHMTYATSPAHNASEWFNSWGPQIGALEATHPHSLMLSRAATPPVRKCRDGRFTIRLILSGCLSYRVALSR